MGAVPSSSRFCAYDDRWIQNEARASSRNPGKIWHTSKVQRLDVAVARLIYAGRWGEVQACDGDVTSAALLFVRWKQSQEYRADAASVEYRILRRVIELLKGRGSAAEFQVRRSGMVHGTA